MIPIFVYSPNAAAVASLLTIPTPAFFGPYHILQPLQPRNSPTNTVFDYRESTGKHRLPLQPCSHRQTVIDPDPQYSTSSIPPAWRPATSHPIEHSPYITDDDDDTIPVVLRHVNAPPHAIQWRANLNLIAIVDCNAQSYRLESFSLRSLVGSVAKTVKHL